MENSEDQKRTAFLLALLSLDGVGRAAAYKLFSSFSSFEDISRYPDEQIAARLKRIPRVTSILEQLGDHKNTSRLLAEKLDDVQSLSDKGIGIVTPDHSSWPSFFEKVSASARPPLLYVYGNAALLDKPGVAVHIPETPATDSAFSVVMDRLANLKVPVVIQEEELARLPRNHQPIIMILQTGLESVNPDTRSAIKTVVKAGGLIVSPFDMEHQHYRHDLPYLNTTVNGIGQVIVYADVPYEHPSFDEMLRLTESGLPIFAINMKQDLPDGVHPVDSPEDVEWILASVGAADT